MRERLEASGAEVTVVVPTGGPMLPVGGRYYPGAGGPSRRKALSLLTAAEVDLLVIPDGMTAEQFTRYPELLHLARGRLPDGSSEPLPLFTHTFITCLLDRDTDLARLAKTGEKLLSGSQRGK
ncbi:MAG: type 1 glutamine amidotransferase family protein [Armatimonadota bacterium]